MTNQKEKIIILIGPTAVGKTKTSIELAKNIMVKLLVVIPCKFTKVWTLVQLK